MIGVDRFASVFGGAPAHTGEHLTAHVRAIIRAGYSPVICEPMTDVATCTLSAYQYKRTGAHPCGSAHVIDDPAKVSTLMRHRLYPNIGLHLGRSSLAVIVAPAAPGATVLAPGGLGHWWFDLPEGRTAAPSRELAGWSFLSGNRYLLVPPAAVPAGAYRLAGGTIPAPDWMLA